MFIMAIQGIIKPPPEIRAVADRTALYVAKNGRAFESRILNSDKGKTPKFSFLQVTSPFHEYYEEKVKFYESGGTDEKEEKKEEEKKNLELAEEKVRQTEKQEKTQRASAIDPIAKALLDQRSKIKQRRAAEERPETKDETGVLDLPSSISRPALQFINIVAPASLSIAEVEAIQLVAQFTALDGRNGTFLSQLIHREWNNPRFAFAQPRHGHFAYFSSLVDAYRTILTNWTAPAGVSTDYVKDLSGNVDKCLETAAYWAEIERDEEERARNEDAPNAGAMIDWQDFIVVETIDFGAHETVDMMPPPPPAVLSQHAAVVDEGMDVSEDEDEQIRVVPSYQPKIATQAAPAAMVIDPITGKAVAAKDMSEHMRIQLLDPKWAEEKKKFQEKQKDSNLVSGDVVAANLSRFTQAIGESRDQDFLSQAESKKKLDEANRILRAQGQGATVGPALPQQQRPRTGPSRPGPTIGEAEPDAKRAKVQVTHIEAPTIPTIPLPPGFDGQTSITGTDDPFAAAGTALMTGAIESDAKPLLPEADFVASLDKPDVTLQIRIPNDSTQIAWNFYGQIVAQIANVMSTIKSVKQELSQKHLNNMPANKIQLKNQATGSFLKDGSTLAALNLGPTASLELVPRARGGGRK
ncbi:hypothetical protein MPSEU_000505300 [Mayamaea pseudoterrestris]|nr:hypothetical protein MPSEU_000505300 [Mayamaea pseudoterrestris]